MDILANPVDTLINLARLLLVDLIILYLWWPDALAKLWAMIKSTCKR